MSAVFDDDRKMIYGTPERHEHLKQLLRHFRFESARINRFDSLMVEDTVYARKELNRTDTDYIEKSQEA